MADLVDMAYSKAELAEEKKERSIGGGEPPAYGWGLCINLQKPELDKLGITTLPGVGDEWHLTCIAKVTSVNQQLRENDDDSTSIGLQITMLGIDLQESAADDQGKPDTPAAEKAERRGALMGKY